MIRRILSLLSAWVKALFAPAKDPREGPTSARRRQEELLARVRDARERVETIRAHLVGRMESSLVEIPRLKDEARRLVQDDREDVARLVLHRRQAAVEHLRFLEEQANQVDKEAQTLAMVEHKLKSEVTASAAYRGVAEARLEAAETRARVGEALSGISDELSSVSETLQAEDEHAEYMRARADAIDELVGLGVLPSSAVRPFSGFQTEDGDLDEEAEVALKGLRCGMDV